MTENVKQTSWLWRLASIIALMVYWSALALGTHLPGSKVPSTPYSDKSLHFWAYAGLAFLLAWAWAARRTFLWRGALVALLVPSAYGGIDEWTQTFVPGRYGDVADWYCDTAGAAIGVAVFLLAYLAYRRFCAR